MLVEIDAAELKQLRLDSRRLRWLLRFWAIVTGDREGSVVRFIDACLERDESPDTAAVITAIGDVAGRLPRSTPRKRHRAPEHYRPKGAKES